MGSPSRPLGIKGLSLFFVFGSLMSGLAALMLLIPGSVLDTMWRLNPRAHDGFAAIGPMAVLLMALVCAACAAAAVGLWRCTQMGFWMALVILTVNLASDIANTVLAHDWRTLIGLPVGAAMITYLVRRRRVFAR
jgi:uncharacterized membrane protein (DUF2068 family)